jgi:hypothetical protein
MQSGFYYKLLDAWTLPLYNLPRWFSVNGYPTLTDSIDLPPLTAFSTLTPAPTAFLQTALSTVADPASGSLLQKLFNVFTYEKEQLLVALTSCYLSRCFYWDASDPEFAWVVAHNEEVEVVQIQPASGSLVTLEKANSELDLFTNPQWSWFKFDDSIAIYGLDIQEQDTENRVGDWQFLSDDGKWNPASCVYFLHPNTKNWIPRHPTQVRSDGFLGFNYNGVTKVRTCFPGAADSLGEVEVYVNEVSKTAQRASLWNSLDEKGLWINVSRRDSELNSEYAQVLLFANWFGGQSRRGTRNFLSAAFRGGTLLTVPATSTSFTVPASSTGYEVRNISQYSYVEESLDRNSDDTVNYRTIYDSPDMGSLFVRGINTEFSSASGVIIPDTYSDNYIDRPRMDWRLNYWTESGSTVTLSSNLPENIPDLVVYLPENVEVEDPSIAVLKKSFNRSSPIFRWRSFIPISDLVEASGLATFD